MSAKRVAQPKPGEPIRVVTTKAREVRYRATIDVSRRGGKRRQVTSTHLTLTEARKRVTQVRADVSRGTFIAPSRVTFRDLADEYLVRVKRGDHGGKAVRPGPSPGTATRSTD